MRDIVIIFGTVQISSENSFSRVKEEEEEEEEEGEEGEEVEGDEGRKCVVGSGETGHRLEEMEWYAEENPAGKMHPCARGLSEIRGCNARTSLREAIFNTFRQKHKADILVVFVEACC